MWQTWNACQSNHVSNFEMLCTQDGTAVGHAGLYQLPVCNPGLNNF